MMDIQSVLLECAVCHAPIVLHKQLMSTLPQSLFTLTPPPPPSRKQAASYTSSFHEAYSPVKPFSSLQPSPKESSFRNNEDAILSITTTKRKEKSVQMYSRDISKSKEFVEWKETWKEVLQLDVPFCVPCWEVMCKYTNEQFYTLGEIIVTEKMSLEEMQTKNCVETEIQKEIKEVELLEAELKEQIRINEDLAYTSSIITALVDKLAESRELNNFLTTKIDLSSSRSLEKVITYYNYSNNDSIVLTRINSQSLWIDNFRIEWLDNSVSVEGIDVVEAFKKKDGNSLQIVFGTVIEMITILSKYSGIFLKKCCIDNYGFGEKKVSHLDFNSVGKSKFKNALKIILMAFGEIVEFLVETTTFDIPYEITENEFIQRMSFINVSNLTNWGIALKYFFLDIGFTAKHLLS
ncbi:hypothetical protein EIN_475840 [Entamoeba invadens IP1]|uniref:Uncharacterized protein n=1 Tax=Entamoeba invadens IP1 TaxID=370355 RepID=A0A0A1U794_ENTIV|nr:hypothetical protein EIN_475840 [Entamoeba invadens IP1]ELP88882.1 hypothetical protein EIN_475840 [Entamoeba invadens IP1]|eukprot:XP_004255653.1 hypothetical protein EIN_475840 [Entamoeba invadens IP1]